MKQQDVSDKKYEIAKIPDIYLTLQETNDYTAN